MKSSIPDPLQNLFRDLRDRNMLPLVIILIVAIIAVPMLLKQDSSTTPPPASTVTSADAAGGIEGAEIANPVVLAEVPGIRNFQKRLHTLQATNPFKQQLTSPVGLEAAAAGQSAKISKDTADAVESIADDIATDGGGTSTAGEGGDTTVPPSDTTPSSKTFIFFWQIDAKVGTVGNGQKKNNVESLEFLPGKSHPVVQFIQGIGERAAVFVVSRSVTDTHGTGNCKPRPEDCQFLKLKPGQSRTFRYEPNGLQYRIKLTDVNLIKKRVNPDNPDDFNAALDAFSGD